MPWNRILWFAVQLFKALFLPIIWNWLLPLSNRRKYWRDSHQNWWRGRLTVLLGFNHPALIWSKPCTRHLCPEWRLVDVLGVLKVSIWEDRPFGWACQGIRVLRVDDLWSNQKIKWRTEMRGFERGGVALRRPPNFHFDPFNFQGMGPVMGPQIKRTHGWTKRTRGLNSPSGIPVAGVKNGLWPKRNAQLGIVSNKIFSSQNSKDCF